MKPSGKTHSPRIQPVRYNKHRAAGNTDKPMLPPFYFQTAGYSAKPVMFPLRLLAESCSSSQKPRCIIFIFEHPAQRR